MAKKKKSKLKKIGAALAAGLAGAALLGRNRDKGVMTADMDRSMVPIDKRMVQGLNFPASTDYTTGINNMARMTADGRSGVSQLKKGGRVGVGIAKRGFGRAMKGKK
tara:strand:- start:224 stop:544 length:321 start_codon:yes stop_codon:yes gene_type:complete